MTTSPRWLNVTLVVVFLAQCVVGALVWVRRRHLYPLSGRSSGMILSIVAASVLTQATNIGEITVGLDRTPCELVYFSNQWLIFWIANAYFVRAGRIWFQYSAACAKYEASKTNAWYIKNRMWVTGRRMLLATAVLTFVMAIGSAIWFAVLPAREREAPECTGVLTVGPVLFGFGTLLMIIALWVVYKLRNIYDGYFIKSELKYVALQGLVTTIFAAAARADRETLLFKLVWFLISTGFLVFSVWHPIFLSVRYRHRSRQLNAASSINRNDAGGQKIALVDVLEDPDSRELFVEHLKREFSIENILFWDAAKEFEFDCKNNVFRSMEEKNVAAASIYAEYVSRDAPSPVNVAGKIINTIDAELEECFQQFNVADFVSPRGLITKANPMFESASRGSASAGARPPHPHKRGRTLYVCRRAVPDDLFASAANSIFMLMEKDSFTRFQISVRQIRPDDGKEGGANGNGKRGSGRPSWTTSDRNGAERPSMAGSAPSGGVLGGMDLEEARLETALALSAPGGGRHSRNPSVSVGGGLVSLQPLVSPEAPTSPSAGVLSSPSSDAPLRDKDTDIDGIGSV